MRNVNLEENELTLTATRNISLKLQAHINMMPLYRCL